MEWEQTAVYGVRLVTNLSGASAPQPGEGLRMAMFQAEGPVGSAEAIAVNLARMDQAAQLAARYDAHVCVFPEKFNTGYAIGVQQCRALAEPYDGPSVQVARTVAKTHGLAVALPYPERDGDHFYDSIAVIGPDGMLETTYRKTHLYGAAERRNYSFGQDLPPTVQINGMRVGVLNCYECEFPPLYQYLAEQGAQVVIGPTAADYHFPLADGGMSQVPYQDATRHIIPAMASIWKVFVAYANRRGWEHTDAGSWQYQGNSGIWAPNGETVIAAGPDERAADSLLIADCIPSRHAQFSPEGNHVRDNRLALAPTLRPAC